MNRSRAVGIPRYQELCMTPNNLEDISRSSKSSCILAKPPLQDHFWCIGVNLSKRRYPPSTSGRVAKGDIFFWHYSDWIVNSSYYWWSAVGCPISCWGCALRTTEDQEIRTCWAFGSGDQPGGRVPAFNVWKFCAKVKHFFKHFDSLVPTWWISVSFRLCSVGQAGRSAPLHPAARATSRASDIRWLAQQRARLHRTR